MSVKFTRKKTIFYIIFLLIILFLTVFLVYNLQGNKEELKQVTAFKNTNPAYADTTIKYMSLEEKIGQMIISDFGKTDRSNIDSLTALLYNIMPGGIIYNTDSAVQFINFQNRIQKYSKINLFVFSGQNSSELHFSDIKGFPNFNIAFEINNDTTMSNYLNAMLKVVKQINLSSVFLFNKEAVNAGEYMKIADALVKNANKNKLLSIVNAELLLPNDSLIRASNNLLINNGLTGVLFKVGTLPQSVRDVTEKYNYEGLLFKQLDESNLNSDSIAEFVNLGITDFITSEPKKIKSILLELVENELVSKEKINGIVRKILLAKTFTGFDNNKRILYNDFVDSYNSGKTQAAISAAYKSSLKLVKNDKQVLPYGNLKNAKFQVLILGNSNMPDFYNVFNSYYPFKETHYKPDDPNFLRKVISYGKRYNQIILFNDIRIDSALIKAINENNRAQSVSVINFGRPENIDYLKSFPVIIQTFGNSKQEQSYTADALFGGIDLHGNKLKDSSGKIVSDTTAEIKKVRISACLPEEKGLNSGILNKIDSIANDAIRRGAFPGCQVVVFKDGYNVYDKAFGYQTYAKRHKVKKTDLYDLASVTKIAATTTAAMRLYSQGKLRLNDRLGKFFRDTKIDYSNIKPDTIINIDTLLYSEVKDFKKILKYQDTIRINDSMLLAYDSLIVTSTPSNNIFKVKVRDLLLHKSGITPTLPILPYVIYKKNFYDSLEVIKKRFYENLMNDTTVTNKEVVFDPHKELKKIHDKYFSNSYIQDSAKIKIAGGFYFKNNWFDTLWRDTKRLRVYSRKIYQYSDINMILLQSAIDSLNHRSMNSYMRNSFYLPMGLQTICYKPRKYFSLNRIVPTENDKYWREQLLRGYVHDPSAAMLGGVSGNAGLYSDAYDLAVLGQMWLNGGHYGGIRYISKATVNKFTGFQEDSHRGLGFDKPHKKAIIAKDAPPDSFGHTGFTGTCIWVDPVNDIVFVFLSNRVNPSAKNWRINTLKIRQKIHQLVYDAMKS